MFAIEETFACPHCGQIQTLPAHGCLKIDDMGARDNKYEAEPYRCRNCDKVFWYIEKIQRIFWCGKTRSKAHENWCWNKEEE